MLHNPQSYNAAYGLPILKLDAIKTVTGLKREIARVEAKIEKQKKYKASRRLKSTKRAVQLLIDKNQARLKKLKQFLVIKEEKKDAKAEAKLEQELMADFSAYDDTIPMDAQVAIAEQELILEPQSGSDNRGLLLGLGITGIVGLGLFLVLRNR